MTPVCERVEKRNPELGSDLGLGLGLGFTCVSGNTGSGISGAERNEG